MVKYLLSLLSLWVIGINGGRHLATEEGDLLWIATVSDGYSCDDMTSQVERVAADDSSRRMLKRRHKVVETMKSDVNCFIEFSGDHQTVDRVKQLKGIDDVDPNEEVVGFLQWHQDRADQDSLPLDGNTYSPPFTGRGARIYVLDTGIYKEHNDFGTRASYGEDFVGEDDLGDGHGHGTHCASIAAGGMYGIAPEAEIVAVKVLSKFGSGSTTGVIKGVQWAVKDGRGTRQPVVISMSLGGGTSSAMNKAVQDAAKSNIVVVAAGNENQDACNVSPASATGDVITVGATGDTDRRASFSNWGACVNIFAPGESITAAGLRDPNRVAIKSGTSMATPYIAGVALQMLEKNNFDLGAALQDIYAHAAGGKITDAGSNSPNLLGLISTYTGPPTPPTLKPTMPPSPAPATLCVDENGGCFEFTTSMFGPGTPSDLEAELALPSPGNELMCKKTNDDFTDKVVLIERGECLFFDKVKNCEKQGAKAIIIVNNEDGIFPPAYYGGGETLVSSCMVSSESGMALKEFSGKTILWGSFDDDGYEEEQPDGPLCDTIGRRKKCKSKRKCFWKNRKCHYKN
jgi:hypothetical protein